MEENFQAKSLLQLVGQRPKKKKRFLALLNKIRQYRKRILVQDQIIADLTNFISSERELKNQKPVRIDYKV